MPSCLSHRADAWDHCAHELVARRSRFRLRRYGRSSFIDVRELVRGVQVREFSLAPLQHRRDEDKATARVSGPRRFLRVAGRSSSAGRAW